jgi:MFS family permease
MTARDVKGRIHYGWFIVLGGALTFFSCLGLARFAFGMILPSMGKGLNLGYDQMGYLGTANFAGYLSSVAMAPRFLRRFGARRTICGALALIGLSLIAMSRSHSFPAVLGLYFLTGIGSGFATIPTVVLIGQWVEQSFRGRANGFLSVGTGVGIVFSGFLVPAVNGAFGPSGWRVGWLVLGGISLGVACLAGALLRNSPASMRLAPLGAVVSPEVSPGVLTSEGRELPNPVSVILRLGILYLLFGATYMIYGTFVVTSMVQEYGLAEATAGRFWAWVGVLTIFSGPLCGGLSDRIGRRWASALFFALQALSYGLVGGRFGASALYLSVALYGLTMSGIPVVMGASVVDYLGPLNAASGFAAITFFFGAGQTAGPALAGMAARASRSFSLSFFLAAALAALAAVLSALVWPQRPQQPSR